MSGRTKLFGTNISFGATFSPHAMDSVLIGNNYTYREFDKYQWNSNKGGLIRFENANLSFGINFDNKTFNKKKEEDNKDEDNNSPPLSEFGDEDSDEPPLGSSQNPIIQEEGDEGYVKFEIPWNISINYSMRYVPDMSNFNRNKMNYNHKMTADINISGKVSLSKKWDISVSSGYNIERKEISHTNVRITRNLHCWSMSFNLVPTGRYKSYFFNIGVNSSMLRDLKYDKRSSPRDNAYW